MAGIIVDNDRVIGKIKPMHGVGQPPIVGMDCSRMDYLAEASVPYSRLHDVGGAYGGGRFVDIPNLFRDFDADPTDPEAYDFAFTDVIIGELVKRRVEPFFRLGVTIENYAYIKAYHIYPPRDYLKWAKICEGVIRHYTQGWADGFYYDIRYWEIWNEPDNYEEMMENQMWRGTKEQFYEFYGIASKYLKEKFPHLKFGGYASCGFYAIIEAESASVAHCSPRNTYFIDFFEGFLAYVKENHCPLDFFSWHSYAGIEQNRRFAAYARKRLDEAGFKETEHTLNEWNCRPRQVGTMEHAAMTAGMLLALQDTSLDSAMFYDARCGIGMYSGLFSPLDYGLRPAYYAFAAFGELYRRGNQVEVAVDAEGVYAVAAKAKEGSTEVGGCLVIANTNEQAAALDLTIQGSETINQCRMIAEGCIWEECGLPEELPAYSVVCIYYR